MAYPLKAKINGKLYPINTDYKTALKCLEIMEDEEISDLERTYAVIYKLFSIIPEDEDMKAFVDKTVLYLGCGETQQEQRAKERDIDIIHDMKYIIPSFRSTYGIDIMSEDMHWYEFINLISGFTDDSVMSRVREIRNYDLSEVKDAKQRRKIIEAKKNVELPIKLTQEQREALDEFESLFKGGD